MTEEDTKSQEIITSSVSAVKELSANLKPICEVSTWKYEIESLSGDDKYMLDGVTPRVILKGVIQRAETLNQNKRVYPFSILRREVDNYQRFINENRALGSLDHPESSVVELKNISHIIRKTWWDGHDLWGRVEILNTTPGKEVRELLNAGVTIGISSRGVGSTKNEGGVDVVQDDFMLICWDLVSEPSTPGAFLFKEHKTGSLSKELVENARKSWGAGFSTNDGIVVNENIKNACKKADDLISFYKSISRTSNIRNVQENKS